MSIQYYHSLTIVKVKCVDISNVFGELVNNNNAGAQN